MYQVNIFIPSSAPSPSSAVRSITFATLGHAADMLKRALCHTLVGKRQKGRVQHSRILWNIMHEQQDSMVDEFLTSSRFRSQFCKVKTCTVKGAQYIVGMYLLMTAYHSVLAASRTSAGALSPQVLSLSSFTHHPSLTGSWLLHGEPQRRGYWEYLQHGLGLSGHSHLWYAHSHHGQGGLGRTGAVDS